MISAEVMRALVVAGYPVAEPCAACGRRVDPSIESMANWLVQRRVREIELAIRDDASWVAAIRWAGPDRSLEGSGRTAADALAKIVVEVAARDPGGPRAPA